MNIISTLKDSNKNNFDQQKLEEESVLLSGSYDDDNIAFVKQSHDHILIEEFLQQKRKKTKTESLFKRFIR